MNNVPLKINRAIVDRAKILYTQYGNSPEEILEVLSHELASGSLTVPGKRPEAVELPKVRSTINRWAKLHNWQPHWRMASESRQEAIERGEPFAISGITDPVWHLSSIFALRQLEGYLRMHPHATNKEVIQRVTFRVMRAFKPGPGVLRKLRPFLQREAGRLRKPEEAERALEDYRRENIPGELSETRSAGTACSCGH